MEEFVSQLHKLESKLWSFYFPVPQSIAQVFIDGNNRRVVCTVNNRVTYQTALMPSKDGWFILANAEIRGRLGLITGDEVSIQLESDSSDYGMEMPESLRTMLDQDPEGCAYFDCLTPGKKRNLIYLVANVKNIDSQIRKSLAILDHLKEVNGSLDFKLLNQKIKEYNQSRR